MFAIEVDFLTGRYTAHSHQGYGTREWPPHPGRLYSALVAAYYEHGYGTAERTALEWLERQRAPSLHFPTAHERDTVTVFVPHYDHNQIINKGGAEELIPDYRASSNKERTYPTVLPEGPVHFIWPTSLPEEHAAPLDRLAGAVPYLGQSSSLVRAKVDEDPPEPNFVPADNRPAEAQLRVVGPGRLDELDRAYDNGQRPPPAGQVGYATPQAPEPETDHSGFGTGNDVLVLRIVDGPTPPLEVAQDLTTAVRRAILSVVDDPAPGWISGHSQDGGPVEGLHVAFVPLANIGHRWADGSILGVALLVPRKVSARQKRTLFQAIDQLDEIGLGSRGAVTLERTASPTKAGLKREPYTRAATHWTTVTPYVYDRYPNSKGDERDEVIAKSCEFIDLPRPTDGYVIESGVSPVTGVPNAGDVQVQSRLADYPRRHLILKFDRPVQGPVTIGRGRFKGIGLMRALDWGEQE